MAIILIDSCVVSDLSDEENTFFDWSVSTLERLDGENVFIINPVIYAEVSVVYDSIESYQDYIDALGYGVVEIPREALFLAGKAFLLDLKLAIIERNAAQQNPPADRATEQPRIGETLPPHTVVQLQQLGLWQSFSQCRFLPAYGACAVWGNDSLHHNAFLTSPYSQGWHLDRRAFDTWLVQATVKRQVDFFHGCTVGRDTMQDNGVWRLPVHNAQAQDTRLTSRFVVDATGRNANFACSQGAQKQVADRLVGIYQFYQLDDAAKSDTSTLVESHETGWWYSALLPGKKLVLALMTDADIAHQNQYQKADRWRNALQQTRHTHLRLHKTASKHLLPQPKVIAAHSQRLDIVGAQGWLAAGDAAFTYDPLSSLGIFKALRMGSYAAFAIADVFQGKDHQLNKYQAVARAEYTDYLLKRRGYYQQERRFPEAMFWQRRQKVAQHQAFGG